MLDTATVTLSYREFRKLLDEVEKADKILQEHGKEESKLDLSFERYMAFKTILRNEHDPDIPSYEQWKQELIESDKKGII
ncbi:hypothetical protein [Clostridium tyrobutyricum]|uniref:hypothetical protein n=1 Tax=Clostridium tyrobutyricum TaxID=1519 RepID=UPI001C38AB42|nr:hypothetical protein [Clostridium tyrobutyricum]MBV4441128.1 hypothetical protein [Clostridium tyrobutyricum]